MGYSSRFICVLVMGGLPLIGCGTDSSAPPEAQVPVELEEQRPDDTADEWAGWERLSCDLQKAHGAHLIMFARASGSKLRRCGWFVTENQELTEFEGTCEDEDIEPGFVLCRGYRYDVNHGTANMIGHAWLFEKQ